ncbi:hypothetical protein C0992_003598 [Termitomyces sp. T32_za158]|nr:hypothetical protein C0992_003598 [Termitomyces sp. T32_za158]
MIFRALIHRAGTSASAVSRRAVFAGSPGCSRRRTGIVRFNSSVAVESVGESSRGEVSQAMVVEVVEEPSVGVEAEEENLSAVVEAEEEELSAVVEAEEEPAAKRPNAPKGHLLPLTLPAPEGNKISEWFVPHHYHSYIQPLYQRGWQLHLRVPPTVPHLVSHALADRVFILRDWNDGISFLNHLDQIATQENVRPRPRGD